MDTFLEMFVATRMKVELTTKSVRPTDPAQIDDKQVGVLPKELMLAWTAIHDFGAEVKKAKAHMEMLAIGIIGVPPEHPKTDEVVLVEKYLADLVLLSRLEARFQKAMGDLKEFNAYRAHIKRGAFVPRLRVDWKMVAEPKKKSVPPVQLGP